MRQIKNNAPEWARRILASTAIAAYAYAPALMGKGYTVDTQLFPWHHDGETDFADIVFNVYTFAFPDGDQRNICKRFSAGLSDFITTAEELTRDCSRMLHEISDLAESLPVVEGEFPENA